VKLCTRNMQGVQRLRTLYGSNLEKQRKCALGPKSLEVDKSSEQVTFSQECKQRLRRQPCRRRSKVEPLKLLENSCIVKEEWE
jgi:hypothetical protein